MRSILIGGAAALLAISSASPAFAQYGGSPDEQVDQDYDNEVDQDPVEAADDAQDAVADMADEAEAYPDEGYPDDAEDQVAFEDEGPPPEEREADDDGDTWQGEDGRSYCRRSDGTTGLIVGGGAGALVGRGIDSRGRRGTGTIIGAIAGAVIGSAIERSANEQRCR
jgi:hypothetical protein